MEIEEVKEENLEELIKYQKENINKITAEKASEYFGKNLVDFSYNNVIIRFPEITITASNTGISEKIFDLFIKFDFTRIVLYGIRLGFQPKHLDNCIYTHSHLSSGMTSYQSFCLGTSSFKLFWSSLSNKVDDGELIEEEDWIIFFSELVSYLQCENHENGRPYSTINSVFKQTENNINVDLHVINGGIRRALAENPNSIIIKNYNDIFITNSYDFWNKLALFYWNIKDLPVSNTIIGCYDTSLKAGIPFLAANRHAITYTATSFFNYSIYFKNEKLNSYVIENYKEEGFGEDENDVDIDPKELEPERFFFTPKALKNVKKHIEIRLKEEINNNLSWIRY